MKNFKELTDVEMLEVKGGLFKYVKWIKAAYGGGYALGKYFAHRKNEKETEVDVVSGAAPSF